MYVSHRGLEHVREAIARQMRSCGVAEGWGVNMWHGVIIGHVNAATAAFGCASAMYVYESVCVCVRARACVRAHVCARACVRAHVSLHHVRRPSFIDGWIVKPQCKSSVSIRTSVSFCVRSQK